MVYVFCRGSFDRARSANGDYGSTEAVLVGVKGLISDTVSLTAPLSNLHLL